jgi:hypothetical protein
VQVVGEAWRAAMRIVAGIGDLVQRTGEGRIGRVLSGRAIGRSGSAVCGLHRAHGDKEHRFLCLALKPRLMVCEWFGLKTTWTIFTGLASKPVATVSGGLATKPAVTIFSSLASKLVVTVSPDLTSKPAIDFLVEPKNQGGGGFPSLGLKTGSSGLVIWASKSP